MSFIFLSYAREDQGRAKELWTILTGRGFDVWMDSDRLLPGQRWDPTIRLTIEGSSGAVFLASQNSLGKDSYIQRELDALLQRAEEVPDDQIFLIIVRLDDTPITDERLQPFHWASYFRGDAKGAKNLENFLASAWKSMEHAERRSDQEEDRAARKSQSKGADEKKPYVLTKGTTGRLFLPEDLDIYVNKVNKEAFIFHGPVISYDISRLVYVPENHAIIVVMNDGGRLDLGVRIQYLIRPYFVRAKKVRVIRTKNQEKQEEVTVPLRQGVLGSNGALMWPAMRGVDPLVAYGNAVVNALSRDQVRQREREREREQRSQDPLEDSRRAKVIASWGRWLFGGCLILFVLTLIAALIAVGVLIGKRL